MTRVDLTKTQCAELANYLRGVLNNGMGAGSFDKIEMLVLARRALAAAEELPEASSVAAHAPAARKPQPEDASAAGSPASEAAQLKRDTLERLTAYRQKDGLNSLAPLAAACGKVDGKVISAELLARMLNRERFDTYANTMVKAYGWETSGKTRPQALAQLHTVMEESPELVVSQWTLGEMVVFVYDAHGKPQAAVGEHDDLVMAAAITHTARTQQRYTVQETAGGRQHWTPDMWEDWRRADPETRKYLEKKWAR